MNFNGKKFKRVAKYKSYASMPDLEPSIKTEDHGNKIISLKGDKWRILQIKNKPARQLNDMRVRVLVEKIDIGINLTE